MAAMRQPDNMLFRSPYRGKGIFDERLREQGIITGVEEVERTMQRGGYIGTEQGMQIAQGIARPGLASIQGQPQAAG